MRANLEEIKFYIEFCICKCSVKRLELLLEHFSPGLRAIKLLVTQFQCSEKGMLFKNMCTVNTHFTVGASKGRMEGSNVLKILAMTVMTKISQRKLGTSWKSFMTRQQVS